MCDFSLDLVKGEVYVDAPQSIQDLKDGILEVTKDIQLHMCELVMENFQSSLQLDKHTLLYFKIYPFSYIKVKYAIGKPIIWGYQNF